MVNSCIVSLFAPLFPLQGAVVGAVLGFVISTVCGTANATVNSYGEFLNSTVENCSIYNQTVLERSHSSTRSGGNKYTNMYL